MSNTTPQTGIFDETAIHSYFLEYRLKETELAELQKAIRLLVKQCLDGQNSQGVKVVVSFSKSTWQLLKGEQPFSLRDFYPVKTPVNIADNYQAMSTQGDIFFWLQGDNIAHVFDQAMVLHHLVTDLAEVVLEQRGFDYHNSMDLIGFEDGTANPKTDDLKRDAAMIKQGDVGAGGSLVMLQKWVHNLDKWNQVPVHCQEAIVGRTKIDNEELQGDAMPIDSHISRTDLKVDGEAMKIYRRSSPFGTVQENGLMFLAFACDLKRFTTQLESMYGHNDTGVIDQLLHYSNAVSGSYYFAPSQQALLEL